MPSPVSRERGRPRSGLLLALALAAAALIPTSVGAQTGATLTNEVLDQYRDLIGQETLPFTIAQAVEVAQLLHPNVRRSAERLEEFPHLVREARAPYLPQLDLTLQALETRDPGFRNSPFFSRLIEDPEAAGDSPFGDDPEAFGGAFTFGTYGWNFQLSQTLWSFRFRPAMRGVDIGRRIAEVDLAEVKNLVARDTATSLYGYLLRERTRDVLQQAITTRERALRIAEDRLELGAGSRLDVLRARVGLSRLRRELQEAEDAVTVQRAAINALVGRDQDLAIQVLDPLTLPDPLPRVFPPEALMELAGEHRPELRRYRLDQDRLRLEQDLVSADSRPEVRANASYGISTFAMENTWDFSLHNWTAGVFVNWRLFDGLQTGSRAAGLRSQETQSEWDRSQYESVLEVDLRAAAASWRGALAALEEATLAVEEAREAERVAEEELAAGAATPLVVLESAQVRREIELELARNTHDALNALAEIKYLVGFPASAPHSVIADTSFRTSDAAPPAEDRTAPETSPPAGPAGDPRMEDRR